MAYTRKLALVALLIAAVGCGGAEPEPQVEQVDSAATSGSETPAQEDRGMQVEGILGKIPESRIEDAMTSKLPAFQRCFFDGMAEVELLAGHFKFYFRVGLDGRVEYVHPRGSSVGHRATELCLLDIAKRTRFPKPQGGGAAEFVWGFEIDAPGGVRAPVSWDEERVLGAVRAARSSLEPCGLGDARYTVTVYIAPGGSVQAAGAAADSQAAADKIDCVLSAVKSWPMPDPGSYPAKVSFGL